ncbi:dynamin family protein [Arcanobacterium buesumense]|uniref:ABC transporter n=1 Tax=Arcanobacterium buesumense TaxID=2722751 RepID=A0A6H2EJT5_9ACTO|nr:dynamin family protein [Arcanobacterium buesumense]QJC21460.1 ABC transporter [Arcanobacterium buesumense]
MGNIRVDATKYYGMGCNGKVTANSFSRKNLADLVRRTVSALREATLPLEMPGSFNLEGSRRQLLTQLESRILPHIEARDVPAVIVFGGSSGAGKSTLVNSIVRADVSPASVLRPTTRTPMVVMHPDDAEAMSDHALLEMGKDVQISSAIQGVVLVDAPDLDSVDDTNRELSARLLDAADLWVFVTTAARYGDALAWNTLQNAHERGITCAVVLDRVSERALSTVRSDLARRMGDLGLADAPLFIIPDQGAHEGLLSESVVAELRSWLEMIAATKMGDSLVDRTTRATLPALREQLLQLADALEVQEHALQDLKDKAIESAHGPLEKLCTNISHGRFGQGAPTASWLSFASTGGVLAGLVSKSRPSIFDRKRKARDNAVTASFDILYTAIKVALTQALVTAQAQADEAWKKDVVNTAQLREQVRQRLDIDAIVTATAQEWKKDLAHIAHKVPAHPWLSHSGVASLLGCAAGGISGANSVARSSGLEARVDEAQEALVARVNEALDALTGIYIAVASEIKITDSTDLRLRASEYLAHS